MERFWLKSIPEPNSGCWLWTGARDSSGYGSFRWNGRSYGAHRLALELTTASTLSPVDVACHHCDNPACINPEHLFVGSAKDNAHDRERKNRGGGWKRQGERNGNSKLTDGQVVALRVMFRSGRYEKRTLGAVFDVSTTHVTRLLRGASRKGNRQRMGFKKATKNQARLRLAISGPAGSGKTFTALTLARHLGKRVAVIDSERGSASKYAGDLGDFDTQELKVYSVQHYLHAITEAAEDGYDVLVIDSLSHAWAGKGGVLEEVDRRGGKFDAWRYATPMQQALVDAMLSYPGHVIATMRSKTDYQVTTFERNGKRETRVEKLGLAPVQRDDLPYEFDVVLDMNDRNVAHVAKTRCAAIAGQAIDKPGAELAMILLSWLSDGATVENAPASRPLDAILAALSAAIRPEDIERIRVLTERHWSTLTIGERQRVKEAADEARARIEDVNGANAEGSAA